MNALLDDMIRQEEEKQAMYLGMNDEKKIEKNLNFFSFKTQKATIENLKSKSNKIINNNDGKYFIF